MSNSDMKVTEVPEENYHIENRKYLIKLLVFFALAAAIIFGLSRLTTVCLREKYNYEYIYEIPKETVDVAFVGPSTSYCAFSPVELYERYGITSITIGSANQSALSSFLWVEEVDETLGVDVIVLDAGIVTNPYGEVIRNYDSIHSIKTTKRYLELFYDHKVKGLPVLAPVFMYHGNWKKFNSNQFADDPNPAVTLLRGFNPLFSKYDGEEHASYDSIEANSINVEYLDRIVDYCDEKNIELILVKPTINNTSEWDAYLHSAVEKYAVSKGITFIDYNTEEYMNAIGFVITEDLAMDSNHVNYYGAVKITDHIGKVLLDEYSELLQLNIESDYMNSTIVEEANKHIITMEEEYGVN